MPDYLDPHTTGRSNGDLKSSKPPPVVLVVEDDDGVRYMLGAALPLYGFTTRLAGGGEEAIEVYQPDEVDLVLIDVKMPGMDGVETLKALQEINPKVICVFMSGYMSRYQPQDLMDAGAAGVIAKPFYLTDLRKALQEALEKGKGQQS